MSVLNYKGFIGSVEISEKENILYGKVLGIKDLISYEGKTVSEVDKEFRSSIDDYLELCRRKGIDPQKSYKGSFNVRVQPELHKRIAETANTKGMSLNQFVQKALVDAVSGRHRTKLSI